jgi:translation initiation factor 2 subunit 1
MLNIAIKGNTEIDDLKLQKKVLVIIEDICSKMKLPSVELRGILEISNNGSNGVELIQKTLTEAENSKDAKIDITYLGAPRYRLSLLSQDFKTAEKSLKPILEKIEKNVKKQNGLYNFTREESIKTGEG